MHGHLVKERKELDLRALENMAVKKTLWQDVLARFLKNKSGIAGFVIVVIMILLILFAPLLTRFDYDAQSFPDRFCIRVLYIRSVRITSGGIYSHGCFTAGAFHL